VGKPEGNRPLERPRRRCEDGMIMDLGKIGWWCVDWVQLAQERGRRQTLSNEVMNLPVLAPQK
jgi:hypothetical protein